MKPTKCASCGSDELLTAMSLYHRGLSQGEIALHAPPRSGNQSDAWSHVEALTCIDCGHIQLHATDFAVLRAAYEKQRDSLLRLG